jgi:hypothetical protein
MFWGRNFPKKEMSGAEPELLKYTAGRGGLGSKGLCNIPCKKFQKSPEIPPKSLFLTFCKSPCDQSLIATMASPPLTAGGFETLFENFTDVL